MNILYCCRYLLIFRLLCGLGLGIFWWVINEKQISFAFWHSVKVIIFGPANFMLTLHKVGGLFNCKVLNLVSEIEFQMQNCTILKLKIWYSYLWDLKRHIWDLLLSDVKQKTNDVFLFFWIFDWCVFLPVFLYASVQVYIKKYSEV